MPASQYLGANRLISTTLRLLGRDQPVPYPLGLERDGEVLLKPYCPPYYPSMEAAVREFVARKFGPQGGLPGWGAGERLAGAGRENGGDSGSHRGDRRILRVHL
jgi:hypothetical protein